MNKHLPWSADDVQNASGACGEPVPMVDAHTLLGEVGVLAIVHGKDTYRLTRTKQNKLLLTKCLALPGSASE